MSSPSSDSAQTEFNKFCKFFTIRLVQAVVQARLGTAISQSCADDCEAGDWEKALCMPGITSQTGFNVRVDELGEISAHLRHALRRYPPTVPSVCLDFLLHTVDGETLPLESWCVTCDVDSRDPGVNVRTQLYHQLGTLLKSVIAAARVTPTYRNYVRRQSPDTFVVIYKVSEGANGEELDLGEGLRHVRLGSLPSPYGQVNVDLRFRTKMEIDTRHASHASAFGTGEASQRECEQCDSTRRAGRQTGGESCAEAMSPVEDVVSTFSTSPTSQSSLQFASASGPGPTFASSPPDHRLSFRLGRSASSSSDLSHGVGMLRRRGELADNPNRDLDNAHFAIDKESSPRASSSFPQRSLPGQIARSRNNSFPFAALLTMSSTASSGTGTAREQGTVSDRPSRARTSSIASDETTTATIVAGGLPHASTSPAICSSTCAPSSGPNLPLGVHREESDVDEDDLMQSSDDSYVKVAAFASGENLDMDLGEFVRQCKLAPSQLTSFGDRVETAAHISEQLAEFQAKKTQFEDFVAAVCSKSDCDE